MDLFNISRKGTVAVIFMLPVGAICWIHADISEEAFNLGSSPSDRTQTNILTRLKINLPFH